MVSDRLCKNLLTLEDTPDSASIKGFFCFFLTEEKPDALEILLFLLLLIPDLFELASPSVWYLVFRFFELRAFYEL